MALSPYQWPTPRSAYIHVPFCRHRCGYCNFSVVVNREDLTRRYLQAVDLELAALNRPTVDTVFIGGGTPTHLDLISLDRLLAMIQRRFALNANVEWTIEANPEDITDAKLDLIIDYGVNRVSLGVQSFNDQKLGQLERGHRANSARQVIETVAAKIPNVSIDLIFAAPGETIESWSQDLDTALSLPIKHLSTYTLTYEKGTAFWNRRAKGELQELGESFEVEMYSKARSRTASAGFKQYEISSFARGGFRCRHNLAYWKGSPWYAAGPSATRFVAGKRDTNHRSTTTYLKRIEAGENPTAESEPITGEESVRERAAFGIRMIDGVDLREIQTSTGFDMRQLCGDAIRNSVDEGMLDDQGDRIRLTEKGILFADMVAARFLG
jgi:oxygen-independent coproporphyrinogen-3 oxidase